MRFRQARRNSIREAPRSGQISSKDSRCESFAAHLLRSFELCPLVLNRLHDFGEIEIQALRSDHKLLHLPLQKTLSVAGAGLWDLCYHRSNPRTHFEPALLDQVLYNFVGCVGVDFELYSERSNRGKCLARLKFATDERPLYREY